MQSIAADKARVVTSSCNLTTSILDFEKFLEKGDGKSAVAKQAKAKEDSESDLDERQKELKLQVAELELELELQMLESISSEESQNNPMSKFQSSKPAQAKKFMLNATSRHTATDRSPIQFE